ncbi:hypothetical protein D9756_000264 [Leucocoprinus leucothites]|uniref:Uncharacterized protein n=1 Tax=Leucocoprinus leucothites TaxID=201217 RepID=A0A8H5LN57_9AGAR|nr:hypothetical protein D9756_000264 [Leucoagaricus leucothites]
MGDRVLTKVRQDNWSSSPPQVLSYFSLSGRDSPNQDIPYSSCNCGFGWAFKVIRTTRPWHLGDQFFLYYRSNLCTSMQLSAAQIQVKVTFPDHEDDTRYDKEFIHDDIPMGSDRRLGSLYTGPPRYKGRIFFEIALTFRVSDNLAFPITSPPATATSPQAEGPTKKALRHSLDDPCFVDVKFYLFSARSQGRPARPKAVYAKSMLLNERSEYLKNLLCPETEFATGTPCNLRTDVSEEITKLDVDSYDYDSDSDLEDEDEDFSDTLTASTKGEAATSATHSGEEAPAADGPRSLQDGKAYAINGTAYKTWKAFIFYTYTNDIKFNALKSQRTDATSESLGADFISCSPKSMYRFADYADLPVLKSLAKETIRKNLSKSNIITELFSPFTQKYQEIIELEVNYLVENLTHQVRCDFNEVLQMVVLGVKPHCFRVLAFAVARMLGDSTKKAWSMLDEGGDRFNRTVVVEDSSKNPEGQN